MAPPQIVTAKETLPENSGVETVRKILLVIFFFWILDFGCGVLVGEFGSLMLSSKSCVGNKRCL